MPRLARAAGFRLLRRSLRRAFRRIEWVGDWFEPAPGKPAVLYANHHLFHDGMVLGWLSHAIWRRRPLVWMEDLDRFPFFTMLGALPFPRGAPARRAATIRRTAELLERHADTALIYFPEATLQSSDGGVRPFDTSRFARLDEVFPDKQWVPITLRIADWHEFKPVVQVTAGLPHPRAQGMEFVTLSQLMSEMAQRAQQQRRVLLDGRPGPHERWNLRVTAPLFRPFAP